MKQNIKKRLSSKSSIRDGPKVEELTSSADFKWTLGNEIKKEIGESK